MSARLHDSVGGRRLTRAVVAGGLLAIFAFTFMPLWMTLAAFVLGAVAGLAIPVTFGAAPDEPARARRR